MSKEDFSFMEDLSYLDRKRALECVTFQHIYEFSAEQWAILTDDFQEGYIVDALKNIGNETDQEIGLRQLGLRWCEYHRNQGNPPWYDKLLNRIKNSNLDFSTSLSTINRNKNGDCDFEAYGLKMNEFCKVHPTFARFAELRFEDFAKNMGILCQYVEMCENYDAIIKDNKRYKQQIDEEKTEKIKLEQELKKTKKIIEGIPDIEIQKVVNIDKIVEWATSELYDKYEGVPKMTHDMLTDIVNQMTDEKSRKLCLQKIEGIKKHFCDKGKNSRGNTYIVDKYIDKSTNIEHSQLIQPEQNSNK